MPAPDHAMRDSLHPDDPADERLAAPRVPQRLAARRDDILQAARQLFTAEGVGPVTAGRIAKQAGISPGNLYYWFPNKEEVVRALFREWLAMSVIDGDLPQEPARLLALLWERAGAQQLINADYAFFQRELATVLQRDPVLAAAYQVVYAARVEQFTALAERLIAAGLLRQSEPPATVAALVRVLWLVAETAGPFARAIGDPVLDAAALTRAVLAPFLTDSGRAAVGIDVPQTAGTAGSGRV